MDNVRTERHMNGGRDSRLIGASEDTIAGEFETALRNFSADYFTKSTTLLRGGFGGVVLPAVLSKSSSICEA